MKIWGGISWLSPLTDLKYTLLTLLNYLFYLPLQPLEPRGHNLKLFKPQVQFDLFLSISQSLEETTWSWVACISNNNNKRIPLVSCDEWNLAEVKMYLHTSNCIKWLMDYSRELLIKLTLCTSTCNNKVGMKQYYNMYIDIL